MEDTGVGTNLLCFYFHLLCYAAVLINFTYYAQYYAQYYAHVSDLCLGINYTKIFVMKVIRVYNYYRIAGFSREDFNFATGLIRNIKIREVLIRCIL